METTIHTITHYLTTDMKLSLYVFCNRHYMCFVTVIICVFRSIDYDFHFARVLFPILNHNLTYRLRVFLSFHFIQKTNFDLTFLLSNLFFINLSFFSHIFCLNALRVFLCISEDQPVKSPYMFLSLAFVKAHLV